MPSNFGDLGRDLVLDDRFGEDPFRFEGSDGRFLEDRIGETDHIGAGMALGGNQETDVPNLGEPVINYYKFYFK
jgi:hypothetical protein